MEPQQMLFSYLLMKLREKGYDVYDGALPPDTTPYPFIYLSDSQLVDERRKHAIQGAVYQTIDIWHNNVNERGVLSAMILDIKTLCRQLENTSGWLLSECSSRIIADDTTSTPLMHGIIELGFRF